LPKQQQPVKNADKKQKADDKKQVEQPKDHKVKEPVKSEPAAAKNTTREAPVTSTPARETGPSMNVSNTRGH
jgi:hypothetical protein